MVNLVVLLHMLSGPDNICSYTTRLTIMMYFNQLFQHRSHSKLPDDVITPKHVGANFNVLLTVHLSIFMSIINQLDAQNFVHQFG